MRGSKSTKTSGVMDAMNKTDSSIGQSWSKAGSALGKAMHGNFSGAAQDAADSMRATRNAGETAYEMGRPADKLAGAAASAVGNAASAAYTKTADYLDPTGAKPAQAAATPKASGSAPVANKTAPSVTSAPSATKPTAPVAKTAPLAGKALQSRISDLAKSNKIANVNKIYYGKSMDVGGQKYTIQKGDTLTSIAKKFSGSTSNQPVTRSIKTSGADPTTGGSDKEVSLASTYPKKSSIGGGRSYNIGNYTRTPIQQHDSVPTTDRAAAVGQMFDMNRKSPGSTADLAKRVNPPSEPSTSMPTPSKVKAQFGDMSNQSAPEPVKDVKMRPISNTVKENEVTPGSTVDDPTFSKKSGRTPGDGSGTSGSTGPDNAATLSKTTPSSRKLSESVQVGDNKYRIV